MLLAGLLSVELFSRASAAGDVTLSATFHDDDAEDTHRATQWVIRDDSETIYDSGTDTTNKESITLSASYFTAGTTYYWKARMQDNQYAWGPYCAEDSFTYAASSLSPTPGDTATSTATATASSSASVTPSAEISTTASSTVTTTATQTVFVSPEITSTSSLTPVPKEYLMDAEVELPKKGEVYRLNSDLVVRYFAYSADLSGSTNVNPCKQPLDDWQHDLYVSVDGGASYERVISDIDYTANCQYIGPDKGDGYIRVETSWHIPDDKKLLGTEAKVAVVVYSLESGGLGSRFSVDENWDGNRGRRLASDASDEFSIVEDGVSIDVIKPERNEVWFVGESESTKWKTNYDSFQSARVEKVKIFLSTDGGENFDYALSDSVANGGAYDVDVIDKYKSEHAVVMVRGLSSDEKIVAVGKSKEFVIRSGGGCVGDNCVCLNGNCTDGGGINETLILATIISLVFPYAWVLMSYLPLIPKLTPALQYLFGNLLSLTGLGELTGWPIFFPPQRKGQKSWGIVYNSTSKKPISGATVKIYTKSSGRLKDVKFTNENGEFSMLVAPGSYKIVVVKPGYKFPSSIILTKQDGRFVHVYRGGLLEIKQGENSDTAPVNISVPMDTVGFSIYEAVYASSASYLKRFLSLVRYPMIIFGAGLSFYLSIKYNNFIQNIISVIYIIVIISDLRDLLGRKNNGVVLDNRGRPLGRAIVRALSKDGKIRATAVTGKDGRFIFNINPGSYNFIAARSSYATAQTNETSIRKVTDLGKVIIRMVKT